MVLNYKLIIHDSTLFFKSFFKKNDSKDDEFTKRYPKHFVDFEQMYILH